IAGLLLYIARYAEGTTHNDELFHLLLEIGSLFKCGGDIGEWSGGHHRNGNSRIAEAVNHYLLEPARAPLLIQFLERILAEQRQLVHYEAFAPPVFRKLVGYGVFAVSDLGSFQVQVGGHLEHGFKRLIGITVAVSDRNSLKIYLRR